MKTEKLLTLQSRLDAVALIWPWLESLASEYRIPAETQFAIDLCLEEAVSNVVRHGYADEIINSIIVLSTPEDYETIKETIAKIDVLPRQVMIEGPDRPGHADGQHEPGPRVFHEGHDAHRRQLADRRSRRQRRHPAPSSTGPLRPHQGQRRPCPASTGFSYIAKDTQGIFRLYVNALANNSNGKLLAAPHILVSDNREARIQVGQQVPIVTSSTILPAGTTSRHHRHPDDTVQGHRHHPQDQTAGERKRPRDAGMSQEVSTFDTIQLGQNQTDIILNKTEASTHLVVQDGHTVVIGGLIREDNSTSKIGVPFLNRIPILGYLFGNTSNQSTRQELIILLTPHVIRNQREAQAATSAYIDNITSGNSSKGGLKKTGDPEKRRPDAG